MQSQSAIDGEIEREAEGERYFEISTERDTEGGGGCLPGVGEAREHHPVRVRQRYGSTGHPVTAPTSIKVELKSSVVVLFHKLRVHLTISKYTAILFTIKKDTRPGSCLAQVFSNYVLVPSTI